MRKKVITLIALLAALTLFALGLTNNQHELIPQFFVGMAPAP
jgi:hypothetical protein